MFNIICLSKENIEEINTRNLRNIESYMTQETVILKSLKQEASKKTILLVSHRESTLRITDDNLVMEVNNCRIILIKLYK